VLPTVAMAVLLGLSAPLPGPSVGLGSKFCDLVEKLPGVKSPIRGSKIYRRGFRLFAKAGLEVKKLAKARRELERAGRHLLDEARETMRGQLDEEERDKEIDRKRVRRFLDKHVLAKVPTLVIDDEAFALPESVVTTMATLACREGKLDEALHHARGYALRSESLAALAVALLLEMGRQKEAAELKAYLGEAGFLAPWARAELETDAQEKLRFHLMARGRAKTPAQEAAVRSQRRRHPGLRGE